MSEADIEGRAAGDPRQVQNQGRSQEVRRFARGGGDRRDDERGRRARLRSLRARAPVPGGKLQGRELQESLLPEFLVPDDALAQPRESRRRSPLRAYRSDSRQ